MTILPDTRRSHLFVLMGPSGSGKSTILHHIEHRFAAESAQKYTTRPARNTEEDARHFIFCTPEEFPATGVLRFESYGHLFGIQLDKIADSFRRQRSHVIIVGNCGVVEQLSALYGDALVSVLVFCDSTTLRTRVLADPAAQRGARWPQVCAELSGIYDQLACIQFVVNNSGSLAATCRQIDRIAYGL